MSCDFHFRIAIILIETISFLPATISHETLITTWFQYPHVSKFWGSPSINVSDFVDAMNGHQDLFHYWVAYDGSVPFCLLITTDARTETPDHLRPFLNETGNTWTLDILIGPSYYMGKGYGTETLRSFLAFLKMANSKLETVLIDPETQNSRAIYVYEKAGFKSVSTFAPTEGRFKDLPHTLMAYYY